ncbi:hypothetical protein TI03_07045, partial [Achromatium sp. WMS1]
MGYAIIIAILLHIGVALGLTVLENFSSPKSPDFPGLQVVLTKPTISQSATLSPETNQVNTHDATVTNTTGTASTLQIDNTQAQQTKSNLQIAPNTKVKSQVVHANLSAKHKHTTDSYSSQSKTINTSTTNSYYA